MVPDLIVNVEGKPTRRKVRHPRAARRSTPGSKECLGEPQGWLRDVLRREGSCAEWSGSGIPIGTMINEVVAEPAREGGAVNPPKLVLSTFCGRGGCGLNRTRRRSDVGGSESPVRRGDPEAAASTMHRDVD